MSTRSRAYPWWGERRPREDLGSGPRRAAQSAEVERLLGVELYGTQRLTNADPTRVIFRWQMHLNSAEARRRWEN